MERLLDCDCNPREMSTAALAFAGDAVYSLLVRERLCCSGRWSVDKLHKRAVEQVRCEAQAQGAARIMDMLTDDERAVYLRGRNMHTAHVPKNAEVGDYHSATGIEALFGYIYLCGRLDRLRELFNVMTTDPQGQDVGDSVEVQNEKGKDDS